MKKILYPSPARWLSLQQRPLQDAGHLLKTVQTVFHAVRHEGDQAVKAFTEKYDGVQVKQLRVPAAAVKAASGQISPALKKAIQLAAKNIEVFHRSQQAPVKKIKTAKGVTCWMESRPVACAGIYIPGGSAPLFSTVLMLGIPAKIAGCEMVVLCSPPGKDGKINPAILYAASVAGITNIYACGGIQAIAAMSTGTKSIPKADKIFGPGNQYVTAAKQFAQQTGVAIDMPAGPSELLVIADAKANPAFVAADLLSQAEHGADSQVILVTDSETLADAVMAELIIQTENLPRKNIVKQSLQHSKAIVVKNTEEAIAFSNAYAPEHLILSLRNAGRLVSKIKHAGSVFLGDYSPESAGDYASGTNHTLPTNGFAKAYSGVSLSSFRKTITFQEVTAKGLEKIGPAIETMAAAEQLDAHKNAVTIRLKKRKNV